jgi:glycerol-3-phosphate acyltransferase PlsY
MVAAVVGYLLGTIPSAGVVAWLATRGEINLREAGSGNPGAINAIKMLGTRWGLVVLAADIAKGAAAGLLGLLIAGDPGAYAAATATSSPCGAGSAAGRAWQPPPARAWPRFRRTFRST